MNSKTEFLRSLTQAVRTTVAALVSLLVARGLGISEPYWATVMTLVVMQSTLGATWTVSGQRLAGTAVGAILATLLAMIFGANVTVFCAGVFLAGLICDILRLDRSAYRFASVTLAIVMLVARNASIGVVAFHRFLAVTVGISVALLLTVIWPEPVMIEALPQHGGEA